MKTKTIDKVVKTDALVIGSGLAGSLAAVGCHRLGLKVALASKGHLCWGGCTSVCGGNAMTVCFPDDNKDSWLREFIESSDHLADQEWLRIFTTESHDHVVALDRLGKQYGEVIFPLDPLGGKGGLWRIKRYANNNPLLLCDLYAAQNAFRKYVNASKMSPFERTEMTHLLVDGERIIGAVGFNYRNGETYLFQTKAVVLACGSCFFRTDVFDVSGEGFAIAYEMGARMASFDQGGARLRPRYVTSSGNLFNSTVNSTGHALGGKLVNNLGEAFFDKVSPETKASGRYGLDMAMRQEIAEGRGPIFEDFTQVPREVQDAFRRMRKAYWKLAKAKHGVDLFQHRVPVGEGIEQTVVPEAGPRAGGVWVDHQCASSVPGLYAVGDNTWSAMSLHHPRGGAGLGWALLSGSRAGKFVADYVTSTPRSGITDKELLEQGKRCIDSLALSLTRTSGLSPDEVTSRLLRCLIPYDEVHSDKESMETALAEIARLQQEDLPSIKARDYHELKKAVEARSMVLTAEMILRSELFREESRCGVRRKDFPMTDNINWLKWIIVQKREGKMHVHAEDVPTPFLEPPRNIYAPPVARL